MNMTIEDIKVYQTNAVSLLRANTQYATATATQQAFDIFLWVVQNEELIGKFLEYEKSTEIRLPMEEYNKLLEYKFMYESLCK